jgi:hypothetical protein
MCDYIKDYAAFETSVQDLAKYPNDKDFIGAFRAQLKKSLREDNIFAHDVERFIRTR